MIQCIVGFVSFFFVLFRRIEKMKRKNAVIDTLDDDIMDFADDDDDDEDFFGGDDDDDE